MTSDIFIPHPFARLTEHVRIVVNISSPIGLRLETFELKVIFGHVRSRNGKTVQRTVTRPIGFKFYHARAWISHFLVHAYIEVISALIVEAQPNWDGFPIVS